MTQPDEDLQQYLSSQPRKQPKPKRAVTSLTFSPQRWQESNRWYSRPLPMPGRWPWWVWAGLGVGGLLLIFGNRIPPSEVSLRQGPVSDENLLNFPPPDPVAEISSDGQAYVTVINAVPGTMNIRLQGADKEYLYKVEPCMSCSNTNDGELLAKFCDRAPQTSFYIPPGEYEAFVSFGGRVASFRSDWNLAESWAYDFCVGGKLNW